MKKTLALIAFAVVAALASPAAAGWESPCGHFNTGPLDLCADSNATITGAWTFTGATSFTGAVSFSTVTLTSVTAGGFHVTGNLTVDGTGSFGDTITASKGVSATTGVVSGTLAVGSTLTVTNAGTGAITVTGGITAGSGAVAIINQTGKIPALSSTYFASLDGSNLTGIDNATSSTTYSLGSPAAAQTAFGVCTTTLTVTTTGNRVLVWFNGTGTTSSVTGSTMGLNVLQDGAFLTGFSSSVGMSAGTNATNLLNTNLSFSVLLPAPSAASHSYCLTSKSSAGNFSFDATDVQGQFGVKEVK